jgi:hypothetical protein
VEITADVVVYMRAIGSDGLTTGATGGSITVAAGTVRPAELNTQTGSINDIGLEVLSLSSTDTHPWAISWSATIPAA